MSEQNENEIVTPEDVNVDVGGAINDSAGSGDPEEKEPEEASKEEEEAEDEVEE